MFCDGVKSGHGRWEKVEKDSQGNITSLVSYEGGFEGDLKDGFGEYRWASGNVYKGNYKRDVREGYGEMNWIDGTIYKGEWKGGL